MRNATHISLYFMFKTCVTPTVYYAMAVIAITRLRFNTLWRVLHILTQLLCQKKYPIAARYVVPSQRDTLSQCWCNAGPP